MLSVLPTAAAGQHSKLLVRGDSRAAYHNHVLQAAAAELRAVAPAARLQLDTLGELWGQCSAAIVAEAQVDGTLPARSGSSAWQQWQRQQ